MGPNRAANAFSLDVKGCVSLAPFFDGHATGGAIGWIDRGRTNFKICAAQLLDLSKDERVGDRRIGAHKVGDANRIARSFRDLVRGSDAVRVVILMYGGSH